MKKILALVACLSLVASLAIGGSIAYLTDRDSEANVFTMGNVSIDLTENYEQGSSLVPGTKIEKEAKIQNTGDNDAYVWMTIAVPANLDNVNDASTNPIHWNVPGAFWEGYHTNQTYINSAIEKGYLPAGSTGVKAEETWNVDDKVAMKTEKINGVDYNVYTLLYNKALAPQESTNIGLNQVYMDYYVDIDPNGEMYRVENGVATKLNWNINDNGNPTIYVSAYAIQAEGFDSPKAAYDAYQGQWGTNGTEYGTPTTTVSVSNAEELKKAIDENDNVIIEVSAGEYLTNFKIAGGKNVIITGPKTAVLKGQIAATSSGTLTLRGVTVEVDNSIADSTGISQTGKSAIAIWGEQDVICENVTFNMSMADSTAITAYWSTGTGANITVKNCTFNCKGQRPIRSDAGVTVENCTFNDPYRYAVQLTSKASTATGIEKAIINFNNNTINAGTTSGKGAVYGLQLEGEAYGCGNLIINGQGNTIDLGDTGITTKAMYYCECGKVDHDTITWNTEVDPVHAVQ